MKTLLHICCAPCSIKCVETLRDEGIEPVGFWFNPNIHPFTEYKARKNTLTDYAAAIGLTLAVENNYGLRTFIEQVCPDFDDRCGYCYRVRMEESARYAAEHGFDSFSTTLLISPYQKHDMIAAAGEAAGKQYGVSFLYRDFRPRFREGQATARALGLYMQKYCGCIFSEEERYQKRKPEKGTQ
ncbi:MAG: hypothetical protein H6Q60_1406 [Oscillospiraceae bacterium]|nr:hypothetical protein [Oscillospiraceae bacterium]